MTSPRHPTPEAVYVQPSSPRFPPSGTPTAGTQRKIGIAVDLSDESAFAVSWAVQNYLRPGDAVILVHVQPTSVLYGADWGAIDMTVREEIEINEGEIGNEETQQKKLEEDFDLFTNSKANDIAQPLVEADIPFKIHIVKDHDMKERLCLEVERLGLSTLIMGSRGFGAAKRNAKGRLGSVSDYCVHHCVCPVVVVRFADEKDGGGNSGDFTSKVLEEEEEEVEESGYYEALNKISGQENDGFIMMNTTRLVIFCSDSEKGLSSR
ncbi:universal stress protein PHOS32 isoform X2 [Tripterygium wilfordii]|uniref:universal stress protein PHOS32 isoform X2 n=1 Tax=Tripterygium wilfordii TaxID=458696 RepID=UPI0018F7E806|nr:universal stress protein PHOS32 isoform X2 [Tripterygium wilfordii]